MARYIDADLLRIEMVDLYKHHIEMRSFSANGAVADCLIMLNNAPTADVEEVVRCKDCKRFMKYSDDGNVEGADGDCFIRMSHSLDRQFCAVKCTDFCSYGQRK